MRGLRKIAFGALTTIGVVGVSLVLLELVAYRQIELRGWHRSWEYITVGDRDAGFTLRPDITLRWNGVDTAINRSGVRDVDPSATVAGRRDDELLVLAVGDSNTFGNGLAFERTFAARTERLLAETQRRAVRVVNLGVVGHTSLQALRRLERFIYLEPDVVVFSSCFNDRAWGGEPDDVEQYARWPWSRRPHELGGHVIYSVLWAQKLRGRDEPLLALDAELPVPRVSPERAAEVLEALHALCRRHGSELILLGFGDDPRIEGLAQAGTRLISRRDWAGAERVFSRITELQPWWFLGWYRYRQSCIEQGDSAAARRVAEGWSAVPRSDPYLQQFLYWGHEQIAVMERFSERQAVPLIDMRSRFALEQVPYRDICHFGAAGHAAVARELARTIAGSSELARDR